MVAPGIPYLFLQILPQFLLPPVGVYLILTRILPSVFPELPLAPLWLVYILALFTQPILILATRVYTRVSNRRKAWARGAIIPPSVNESSLQIIRQLRNITYDYPGALPIWFSPA